MDITYGTNNEFGFDYLRDNMAFSAQERVQGSRAFAIVDEVDSILIDEARTPLIISGKVSDAAKLYYKFAAIARSLTRDEDYEVEEDKRVVVPLEPGIEKVESALGVENQVKAGTMTSSPGPKPRPINPLTRALVPEFTAGMPKALTASTGASPAILFADAARSAVSSQVSALFSSIRSAISSWL